MFPLLINRLHQRSRYDILIFSLYMYMQWISEQYSERKNSVQYSALKGISGYSTVQLSNEKSIFNRMNQERFLMKYNFVYRKLLEKCTGCLGRPLGVVYVGCRGYSQLPVDFDRIKIGSIWAKLWSKMWKITQRGGAVSGVSGKKGDMLIVGGCIYRRICGILFSIWTHWSACRCTHCQRWRKDEVASQFSFSHGIYRWHLRCR